MKDRLETIITIIIGFCIGVLWLTALVLQSSFQMIADFFDSAKEFFSKLGDTK